MGFYGSNDPSNSDKALRAIGSQGLGFHPIRPTSPCYNNITHMQLTNKHTQTAQA